MRPTASYWSWTIEAPSEDADEAIDLRLRADRLVHEALERGFGEWVGEKRETTRSQVKNLIDAGRVTARGKPVNPSRPLPLGTKIEIHFPEPTPLELVPEDRPIEILFEDAHLLVVNKPPGLTVHPSSTQVEGTLVHALLHHVKDLSGIGGVLRPGIVHRIDKDTSGSLVITKTDFAHQKMSEIFAKHEIDREYWALCYGAPEWKKHRQESLIGRNPKDRKKMSMQVEDGRHAVTHFECLERFGFENKKPFASLIRATLETGRTHQVRVHLTGLNHSILGDPVYGTPSASQAKWTNLPRDVQAAVANLPGQALHAAVLGFKHPVTEEFLKFQASPPVAFQTLLDTLRLPR